MMPYKYAVECVCDKIAATKTYKKKDYTNAHPLEHWTTYGCKAPCNPKTSAFIEKVFTDLKENGEKFVFNKRYMKKTYAEICLNAHKNEKET